MKRSLTAPIQKDLKKKIILLTGPRQGGKTTLAKMLDPSFDYLNYDETEQRLLIKDKAWRREKSILILDELHKMPKWKTWLKGIFDTEGLDPAIVVTGSAKLDTYKKVGDSLAGRFFQFRLHPLDLKEIANFNKSLLTENTLDQLLKIGGFPEPFLEGSLQFYNRWKKSHLDIILKQDLIELENIHHITQIETLIQLMRQRVGSPLSYSSLAEDLQCNDKTIKRWLTLLENMYILFRVKPYHKNIARATLKQPKYYFYDTGQVLGEEGVKLENLVASALLKEIHFQIDVMGEEYHMFYLRNKEKNEIDFLITKNEHPHKMIEVKLSDDYPSPAFEIFQNNFSTPVEKIQIVKNLSREKSYPNGLQIKKASPWLKNFSL